MILENAMQTNNPPRYIVDIDTIQAQKCNPDESSRLEQPYMGSLISLDGDLEEFFEFNNIDTDIDYKRMLLFLEEGGKVYKTDLVYKTNRHNPDLGYEIFVDFNNLIETNEGCLTRNDVIKNIAYNILDEIEEMLERKGVTIPDEERICDSSEARLFGKTYYELEDVIIKILKDKIV